VSPEPLDLKPLVDEVVESFAPLARTRGATVRTAHTGDAVALADRDALRQVLLNLLDNAVKYGPAGQTITVGTGVARDGRAQMWVDDQGSGISARDKARVWEPFRRLDRAVEAGISGNGIGLAVVRELVLAQGGAVAIHDAAGGGASFVVTLRASTRGVAPNRQTATPGSFQTERPPAHSLMQ
jgi:signal transduction histidine kinase